MTIITKKAHVLERGRAICKYLTDTVVWSTLRFMIEPGKELTKF